MPNHRFEERPNRGNQASPLGLNKHACGTSHFQAVHLGRDAASAAFIDQNKRRTQTCGDS
jgi:hypothetical protein